MTIGKLDDILNSKPGEEKVERNLFSRIYISKDAFAKARMYASFARDNSGRHIECYGYLLGNGEKRTRLVDDVYFVADQSGTDTHVNIPGESVIEAGREIADQGKRVLGWWHSHATMHTFHSGTDDDNLKTILNQIASSNYVKEYAELDFLTDDIKKTKEGDSTVYICDRNNKSKRLEMIFSELDENPLAGALIEKLRLRIPMIVSYAYSIVVNGIGGAPYSEIATMKFCSVCRKDEYEARKRPLALVNYESEIEMDERKLKKEVKSKLIVPRSRFVGLEEFSIFVSGGNTKKKRRKGKRKWWKKL